MGSVTVSGTRIAFHQSGSGDPLVLIMGLGADASLWEPHIDEYARHFRCIAIDNRGAGASDRPAGPYTTSGMAQDTLAVIHKLGLENVRIAGISMGSAIAQQVALSEPSIVRSMVLISSWSRCDRYMATVFDHFKRIRAIASPEEFTELLQLWIYGPRAFDEIGDELEEGRTPQGEPMPLDAFQAQCDACITHDVYSQLGNIACPCLLTVGSDDIFTPLRFSEEMRTRIPNSTLEVFAGDAHVHHWESLDRFNQVTADFLRAH